AGSTQAKRSFGGKPDIGFGSISLMVCGSGGAGLSWPEIEVVLDAALERAPGERGAWLAARYGDRPETLTEGMSLLSAIEDSEAFLEPEAEIDLLPSGARFGVW